MKIIKFCVLILIFSVSSCEKKITTVETPKFEKSSYYFIRHAEKDRNNPEDHNPNLTETGKARAENWSNIFKNIRFDAVYSTDLKRTKSTATPTAIKNNLELILYNLKELDASQFLKETEGKTVLVVGHSNTTPYFVNKVIGTEKYQDINDNQFGSLFIVTINNEDISEQLLVIN